MYNDACDSTLSNQIIIKSIKITLIYPTGSEGGCDTVGGGRTRPQAELPLKHVFIGAH